MKVKYLSALALCVCLTAAPFNAALAAGSVSRTNAAEQWLQKTDRFIIKYRDSSTAATLSANQTAASKRMQVLSERLGIRFSILRSTFNGGHIVKVNQAMSLSTAQQLAQSLKDNDPNILSVTPDRRLSHRMTPNDTQYGQQWHYYEALGGINAPAAWDVSTGKNVVVAVVDTGVRPHADLAANLLPGYDFVSDANFSNDGNGRDSDASDPGDSELAGECGVGEPFQNTNSSWHGTHVSGTIAAVGNNRLGVVGVAFGAKVLPVRVLSKCGGYTSDILDAVIWAAGGSIAGVPANPTPAKVINLSLGGYGTCDTDAQTAFSTVRRLGASIVVAAGNEGVDTSTSWPANCPGVIPVSASTRAGTVAYYSDTGKEVVVSAPGGLTDYTSADGIFSTLNTGTTAPRADSYQYYNGTSMAAPHVAATVALMLSVNPSLTPDNIISILKSTARPFAAACTGCGTGIVNAYAAVIAAKGNVTPPPPPSPSPTYCLPNASPDVNLGYCADSTNAYGPFTNAMVQKCNQYGGGSPCTTPITQIVNGLNVSVLRWSKSFTQSMRGTAKCPLGSSPDSVYSAYCVELATQSASKVKEIYGPFPNALISKCLNGGGGGACYSTRWSYAFFSALQ